MSFKVVVEKEAEVDMKDAVHWIAQYSPDKATLWYFDATEAIESLENSPARCPLAPESNKFGAEIRHLIFGKCCGRRQWGGRHVGNPPGVESCRCPVML
jgi:hypothetical protein